MHLSYRSLSEFGYPFAVKLLRWTILAGLALVGVSGSATADRLTMLYPPYQEEAWSAYSDIAERALSDAGIDSDWRALRADVIASRWADVLSALDNGTVDIVAVPADILASRASAFVMLELPFIFTDIVKARDFVRSDAHDILSAVAAREGFALLGYFWQLDVLILMGQCSTSPKEFMGRKVRASDAGYGELLQAAGAAVNSLPALDVFPALERGLIDAGVFSVHAALKAGVAKVAACLVGSDKATYLITPHVVVARSSVWETLPSLAQQVLSKAIKGIEEREDQRQFDEVKQLIKEFENENRLVQPLTDAMLTQWRDLANQTVYRSFLASADSESAELFRLNGLAN